MLDTARKAQPEIKEEVIKTTLSWNLHEKIDQAHQELSQFLAEAPYVTTNDLARYISHVKENVASLF